MAWKQKEFYLSTFHSCVNNGEEKQEKCLMAAKESGLNMVEFSFVEHETAEKGIEICERIGLNYIATDMSRYTGAKTVLSPEEDDAVISQVVAEHKDNKYLIGYYTWDEVGRKSFDTLKRINGIFEKYAPDKLPFSIVLPSYGIYTWDKSEANWEENTYAKYVEDYLKVVDPQVLGFDYYPYQPTCFDNTLFENDIWRDMGLMYRLADKYSKPFWFYVQSVELGIDVVGRLTREKILVQVMAALAYGARYISYYIATNYLYDLNGNKTERFESGKAINRKAKIYGDYLLDKKPTGICHTGLDAKFDSIYFLNNISDLENIKAAPQGMIIGQFKGADDNAVMLVNKDYSNALSGDIVLKNPKNIYTLNCETGKRELLAENTDIVSVKLAAGDGLLLIID